MDRMYRFTRIIADHKLISVLSAVPTMQQLDAASAFAPLHTPVALSVIRFARKHYPELPQVACFDTTFHIDLPDVARVLPIPRELLSEGIQRYGFHGLSCESILQQLGDDMPRRLTYRCDLNETSIEEQLRSRSPAV